SLYRRQRRPLVRIGLAVIPIGLIFNGFAYLVTSNPPVRWVISWFGDTPAARFTSALIVGSIQQLAMVLLITPAIIQVVRDDAEGMTPGFRRSTAMTLARLRVLAAALLREAIMIVLLSVTVVGIPWAVWIYVRWGFFAQAIMLDGAPAGNA